MTWKAANKKYRDKYVCVQHSVTKELAMAGKYGEIWQCSSDKDSCVVTSNTIAKRISKLLNEEFVGTDKHDENLFTFDTKLLPQIKKLLKIPNSRPSQIKNAEEF